MAEKSVQDGIWDAGENRWTSCDFGSVICMEIPHTLLDINALKCYSVI